MKAYSSKISQGERSSNDPGCYKTKDIERFNDDDVDVRRITARYSMCENFLHVCSKEKGKIDAYLHNAGVKLVAPYVRDHQSPYLSPRSCPT